VLTDFHADFVCCHLAGAGVSLDHLRRHDGSLPHERFVRGSYPVCTTLRVEELTALFPSVHHGSEGSAVLAPLTVAAPKGCLAIGSRDPQAFTPDMDTLFVTYIAEVLGRVVQRLAV
jgi:uncharacterized protein YigA (DUF484 family)